MARLLARRGLGAALMLAISAAFAGALVPAAAMAATDEAQVARTLPAPSVTLLRPSLDDADRVRACVRVRWRAVGARHLERVRPNRVRSHGRVRISAFAPATGGAEPRRLATRSRHDQVELSGERETYCFRLPEHVSDRLLGAKTKALAAGDIDSVESQLHVDAAQHVDIDRDGAADALGVAEQGPQALGAAVPCDMRGMSAVTGLTTCRNWFVYASPNVNDNAPPSTIESELRFLYKHGFRGVVTYTVAGNMTQVPRIAREIGYQKVLVGLWDPAAEIGRVAGIKGQIDGVVVGNEGVDRRYSIDQLVGWVNQLKSSYPDLAVTGTNEWFKYLVPDGGETATKLMRLGDFLFPTLHAFWDNNPASNGLFAANPNLGAEFTRVNLEQWFLDPAKNTRNLPVVSKESWWPSELTAGGDCPLQSNLPPSGPPPPSGPQWQPWKGPPYSEQAQRQFFTGLVSRKVKFVWGEPFDIPAKTECKRPPPDGYGGVAGPHWGLWRSPGNPKLAAKAIDYGRY